MNDVYDVNEESKDALGKRLLEEMERLDPSYPEAVTWDNLTEHERHFYHCCALEVLEEALARKLVGWLAYDNTVG